MREQIFFLRRFLGNPREVGALAPSSPRLAVAMVAGLDLERAECVVEYGPGTGSFTGRLLRRLGPRTRYLGIEKDPGFARLLAARYPRAEIVTGDVREAPAILAGAGVEGVDAVISGLPFANFGPDLQREILRGARAILAPGGSFVTFNYIHTFPFGRARSLRREAAALFAGVAWRPVMANFPPAFVIRCRKAGGEERAAGAASEDAQLQVARLHHHLGAEEDALQVDGDAAAEPGVIGQDQGNGAR